MRTDIRVPGQELRAAQTACINEADADLTIPAVGDVGAE